MQPITFLTDFGLEDDLVGTCHGVMKRIAPEVEIIDLTHGSRRRASCRERSFSRTRSGTFPRACTSPLSIPEWAVKGAPSRSAQAGGSSWALTTVC